MLFTAVAPRAFLVLLLVVILFTAFRKLLKFPRVSGRALIWCLPCLAVSIVNFPFSALASGTAAITRPDLIWLFILKCVFIGITEEWLFRGLIFNLLLDYCDKQKRNRMVPILLNAVIFALFHLLNLFEGASIPATLLQAGYTFLLGTMFAFVYLKTDNLWLCVILHTIFDCGGLLIQDIGKGNPQDLVFWILTALFGILCFVHILYSVLKTPLCKPPMLNDKAQENDNATK